MPNMKETRETGGNIQNKEWLALKKRLVRAELMENLKQRLKQAELINQRHEEQEKTLKKIQRVKAILKQSGKMNGTQQRMEDLEGVDKALRTIRRTYNEMYEIFEKRMQDFIKSAPKQRGNGFYSPASRNQLGGEIVPGLAFERCETGVFFYRNVKRFLQEKYEEGRKQEYLDKMKLHQKQEFLDRKDRQLSPEYRQF